MAMELPAVSAVIARLDNPEVHLAAYGSIAFPLAVLIEGPIIHERQNFRPLSRHRKLHK